MQRYKSQRSQVCKELQLLLHRLCRWQEWCGTPERGDDLARERVPDALRIRERESSKWRRCSVADDEKQRLLLLLLLLWSFHVVAAAAGAAKNELVGYKGSSLYELG